MLAESELLPLPGAVLGVLWSQVLSGELPGHLGITLGRVAAAFVLGMCLGTAIGMWMGRRGGINASLDALLIIGLNIPALVTIVLCYLWIGLTEVAAVAAVAINKIPTVVVTVREGARVDHACWMSRVFIDYRHIGPGATCLYRSYIRTCWLPRARACRSSGRSSGGRITWA